MLPWGARKETLWDRLCSAMPLRPVLTKVREGYESQGVEAYAYPDDMAVTAGDISLGTMGGVPFLERELTAKGVHLSQGRTVGLTPKGHVPTLEDISPLVGVGVRVADRGRINMAGVPVGTNEFTTESAIGIGRDGRAGQLARKLPGMPDKRAANLIATGSVAQRTAYVERVMDPNLSQPACRRAHNGAMCMLQNLLELLGMAE